MNLQFYWEKLEHSDIFKEFIKENPDAYLCSGFFTIDKEGSDNQRHFDFYIPESKEMFSFKLEKEVEKMAVELAIPKVPEKLGSGFDFELDDVEKMILEEMGNKKIDKKIQKIIVSLQDFKGKVFLICTVFIAMLGLLKVHIDIEQKKIVLFEKKSLFDMVRKVK